MLSGMQDFELRVPRLLDHAAREHGAREVVTRWADGRESRSDWAGIACDARRVARLLESLGCKPEDRVATLAMNHGHHVATWYGAIGAGCVVHTINPRLFDDQLVFIANDAVDKVLFYDKAFAPIVERLRERWPTIEHYVCMDDDGPGGFRSLIDAQPSDYSWVEGDEREACMLCYTSGTTGNPKGVLYSHRSTVLHAMTEVTPAVFGLEMRSVVLPIVPMFHVAAWGLPFATALTGCKLVLSAVNDPAVLCGLMNAEGVTHSAGVPTVWLGLFAHTDATGEAPRHLELVTIGGSAAPRTMIERITGMGIRVNHAWGMTETSPIGSAGGRAPDWDQLTPEQRLDRTAMQGRVPFGVEMRIVDDQGTVLPRDGVASGRLQCRGPWVIKRYFGADTDAIDAEGWFDTGDVSAIHPDGTMQITDRAKDVIKSGGEWISSVELENAAVGCEGVAEAAAIGVAHPRWDERPLLLVVRKAGAEVKAADIQAHLARHVAKWWLPDAIEFVDSLPHTATGKLLKTALRERFRDYRLPSA